jgi:uracil-DNA glycosylase
MPKNVQEELVSRIRACRRCRDDPSGPPLPHEPRPVLRVSTSARIAVCGQAPGTRVHASGVPFSDASGDRLRSWMGVSEAEFYDVSRIAILPMGFCFPGHDAKGADLPPRRECAPLWRNEVFGTLRHLQLVLLIGLYAQAWHLGRAATAHGLTQTVAGWRSVMLGGAGPVLLPLPHPSWRNSGWIKRQPWFEADLLPVLRQRVRDLL